MELQIYYLDYDVTGPVGFVMYGSTPRVRGPKTGSQSSFTIKVFLVSIVKTTFISNDCLVLNLRQYFQGDV